MQINVLVPGDPQCKYTLVPGDSLDLGEHGVLKFLTGLSAEADRLLTEERQAATRAVIAHVREQIRIESSPRNLSRDRQVCPAVHGQQAECP